MTHPVPGALVSSPSVPAFTVHRLTPHDSALMDALLSVFGDAFEDQETYGGARPGKAYIESLLANSFFIALIAVKDGAVVGGLAAYDLPKFERERSEIYIYDLAVAAAHRRAGIATALIQTLRQIAAARSAHVVFV